MTDEATRLHDRICRYDRTTEAYLLDALHAHLDDFTPTLDRCESPIERLLAITLLRHGRVTFLDRKDVSLEAQAPIVCDKNEYRVNFLIKIGDQLALAVECDGHEYHERTKEQAKRDKERDRAILRTGTNVIHFTGSEIVKSPFQCLLEIMETLIALMPKQEPKNA